MGRRNSEQSDQRPEAQPPFKGKRKGTQVKDEVVRKIDLVVLLEDSFRDDRGRITTHQLTDIATL